jgi:hypothetical protein
MVTNISDVAQGVSHSQDLSKKLMNGDKRKNKFRSKCSELGESHKKEPFLYWLAIFSRLLICYCFTVERLQGWRG